MLTTGTVHKGVMHMKGRDMPWFKVDDGLHAHSKVDDAGVDAIGLWTLAGSWSSDQLTDGWVPRARVIKIDPDDGLHRAARLVAAGFWHDEPGCACIPETSPLHERRPGWQFHDWGERQPARQDVIERRERHAERQREWRRNRVRRTRDSATDSVSARATDAPSANGADSARAEPVIGAPTRPDPTTTRSVVVGGAVARRGKSLQKPSAPAAQDGADYHGRSPETQKLLSELRGKLPKGRPDLLSGSSVKERLDDERRQAERVAAKERSLKVDDSNSAMHSSTGQTHDESDWSKDATDEQQSDSNAGRPAIGRKPSRRNRVQAVQPANHAEATQGVVDESDGTESPGMRGGSE